MAEVQNTGFLSIGEVLGLLLEEFPDVTISKIRFLESQGLISPERTSSGYRKFYDDDVELLRVILLEQRENYLPLRVIKDRLKTGEIDPTGEHNRPDDANPDSVPAEDAADSSDDQHGESEVPAASIAAHPAARTNGTDQRTATAVDSDADHDESADASVAIDDSAADESGADASDDPDVGATASAKLLPGVLLDRDELCSMVGMTEGELVQLEAFGIVAARDSGGSHLYGDDAVEIATPAVEFLRLGVDARHLRNWRTSAEREASLYEQLITPRFRQRNPDARAQALNRLRELDALGGTLRAAMTRHALRHHFDA